MGKGVLLQRRATHCSGGKDSKLASDVQLKHDFESLRQGRSMTKQKSAWLLFVMLDTNLADLHMVNCCTDSE